MSVMGGPEVLDQCFKPRDPGMLITPFSPNHAASGAGKGWTTRSRVVMSEGRGERT